MSHSVGLFSHRCLRTSGLLRLCGECAKKALLKFLLFALYGQSAAAQSTRRMRKMHSHKQATNSITSNSLRFCLMHDFTAPSGVMYVFRLLLVL